MNCQLSQSAMRSIHLTQDKAVSLSREFAQRGSWRLPRLAQCSGEWRSGDSPVH